DEEYEHISWCGCGGVLGELGKVGRFAAARPSLRSIRPGAQRRKRIAFGLRCDGLSQPQVHEVAGDVGDAGILERMRQHRRDAVAACECDVLVAEKAAVPNLDRMAEGKGPELARQELKELLDLVAVKSVRRR